MTDAVEKHVSKPALEKLIKAADAMDTATASERAGFGAKLEKAEKEGLNKWAFRIVRQLYKRDPAKAAYDIRALTFYIDLLGLAAQADLEDAIDAADAKDQEDRALIAETLAHGGQAALKRFQDSIEAEDDPKVVQRELTKRIAEWPEITEGLDKAAEARLRELRKVVKLPKKRA